MAQIDTTLAAAETRLKTAQARMTIVFDLLQRGATHAGGSWRKFERRKQI